jgi:hypothetical protein
VEASVATPLPCLRVTVSSRSILVDPICVELFENVSPSEAHGLAQLQEAEPSAPHVQINGPGGNLQPRRKFLFREQALIACAVFGLLVFRDNTQALHFSRAKIRVSVVPLKQGTMHSRS